MEANAGESFQMQILSNIFPRISLHCKLVPVQYREYEYGLLIGKILTCGSYIQEFFVMKRCIFGATTEYRKGYVYTNVGRVALIY